MAAHPSPVLARLNAEVARILPTPDMRKIFEQEGADVVGSSPEAFASHLKAEIVKWMTVAKAAGIKAE